MVRYILTILLLSISVQIKLTRGDNSSESKVSKNNENCNCTRSGGPISTPTDWKKSWRKLDPEEFLKLQLNERQLRGSRWTLEQKSVVDVYHSIEVMDATLIHNNELTLRIEFNLRQKWIAEGLEFPTGLFKDSDPPNAFVTAKEDVLRDMWAPESYISTSRESNMNTVGTPLSLVYIFKNSTIIFKVRMFTKVACSSSFQWYPLDIQTCDLIIESYKYQDDIVRYHWTHENMYRPLVIHSRRLFQYDLQIPPKYDNGTVERGGRGKNYSYIRIKFRFERKLGNNFIQVYTPTVLVVILSWFSFWLGLDAIPGRISLLVTCMLTMVTMHSGMKSSIPPVHYITMMDVWYVCCMAFVFSAMCEFVIVKYIHWRHLQKRRAEERKYQEETRAKLYSIFRRHTAKDQESTEKVIIPSDFRGSNGSILPFLDKQTALASSYWTAANTGMLSHSQKSVTSDQMLQSILVGGMMGEGLEAGNANDDKDNGPKLNDDKKENNSNEETKVIPMWVSMDRFCRGFLPFLFCVFNAIYWPLLFNASEEQKI